MANITITVVQAADGSVDAKASRAAFSAALNQYIESVTANGGEDSEVAETVNSVFDKFPSTRFNMSALCSYAAAEMGATPETHKAIAARVEAYVRANSQGKADKATGAVPNPTSLFISTLGPQASITRRADVEAAAATKA